MPASLTATENLLRQGLADQGFNLAALKGHPLGLSEDSALAIEADQIKILLSIELRPQVELGMQKLRSQDECPYLADAMWINLDELPPRNSVSWLTSTIYDTCCSAVIESQMRS